MIRERNDPRKERPNPGIGWLGTARRVTLDEREHAAGPPPANGSPAPEPARVIRWGRPGHGGKRVAHESAGRPQPPAEFFVRDIGQPSIEFPPGDAVETVKGNLSFHREGVAGDGPHGGA